MIEPVSVPILLDLELGEEELDLSIEEAEEYAAQIGSLIAISEVYGGLPSGGSAGEILIKNSDEDYDAIWGTIKNGANIWWTSRSITQGDSSIYIAKRYVVGRTDVQPEIHDFLVGQDIGVAGSTPNTLYEIIDINQLVYNLKRIGNIGENDYNKLLNKPQIDGIEINKDSTPASLGLATASALEEKYTKPSGGIPASDLAEGVIPEVHNIPSGGSIGQALIKNSNEDYDAIWSDIDSELPDVNSTDYGKVLTVSNDGIWNAQQPIFMVTITNNNNVFSANKTFSEITNAAIRNMIIVATYAGAYYQYCGIGGGAAIKQFVYIFTKNNIQTIRFFSVNISNVWTQYQYQLGTYSKPDSGIPVNDLASDVHLIPSGGTIGQVLRKISNNDWDINWDTVNDGADGNSIWTTNDDPLMQTLLGHTTYYYTADMLTGREEPEPQAGDIIIKSASVVYRIISTLPAMLIVVSIGSIKGADGQDGTDGQNGSDGISPKVYISSIQGGHRLTIRDADHPLGQNFDVMDGVSPNITITEISGGHRVTITDADHPDGQSFDVMDGSGGGGGTSDYSALSNKPSIEGVTLSGNKTAEQLGLAKASDIPSVPVQSVNGKTGTVMLGASDVGAGTYSKPSGGIPKADLAAAVQSSLDKADTALQSAPVTSVNGQIGNVVLSIPGGADEIAWTGGNLGQQTPPAVVEDAVEAVYNAIPSTATDVGAVAVAQGVAHAGEFIVVGSDGNITTVSITAWQGGSY